LAALAVLPRGVYFGWARLEGDSAPRKAVLNVGVRPTFAGEPGGGRPTVEVHLLHAFPQPFYGRRLRVLCLGFLRPELRFGGLQQLVARIRTDVGIASALLDQPALAEQRADAFLA
jgi:riboflavin kinase